MKKIIRREMAFIMVFAMFLGIAGISQGKKAAAAEKSIYVLDKIICKVTNTTGSELYRTDKTKIKYNEKGLVTQSVSQNESFVLQYDDNDLITNATGVIMGTETDYTLNYGEDGYLTNIIYGKSEKKFSFESNGDIKSMNDGTRKYNYTCISGNRISKIKWKYEDGDVGKRTFKYDKKGNLLIDNFIGMKDTYINSYKKGLLVKRKRMFNYDDAAMHYKYKYKKVSIDDTMVETVKRQQWALLNDCLNSALPREVLIERSILK